MLHPDDRKLAEQLVNGSLLGNRNQSTVRQAHYRREYKGDFCGDDRKLISNNLY